MRTDHDSLHRIDDVIKNACIVVRFARPIVAKRRGLCEPLALAALAALCNALQELTVEEAKQRRHCIISGIDSNFLNCRAQGSD
jgi:hypothetical protein